ncbi:TolC family outer membrane protein [Thiomicrorhabdus sp. 6S3-12]|uniref:TolC family outer membrane protein n=1 Tax=Thiomicrorhabdus sp. 6S3-12 TaxID=2819681 RepID=UPI001AAE0732|nr:TolC family outer membrane protein [Thiomicrorhabdus sp. 6S3-12]MBO1923305.1 TolC family outer membrane protein [Thiomicrorhabdus sp. 6S3-12]
MNKRFPKLLVALSSALALNSFATSAQAIELVPTVEDAILHSPEFRQQVKEKQGVEADLRGAEGGWLPSVDLGAGIGKEKLEIEGQEETDLDRKEASISLTQNLFEGFGTQNEIKRQEARLESSKFATKAAANKVALDMVSAYMNLLKEQQLLNLAEENKLTHERILDQIVQRSQAGVGNQVEVDQAKARLALANANVTAAKNNYQDVLTRFHRVLGRFPDSDLIKPNMDITIPNTLEEAINTALMQHPTLRSANADITSARAQYATAQKLYYPRVDVEVMQTFDENINGIEGKYEDFQAMLRVRYNLFNGGKDQAVVDRAAADIYQSAEVRNNTRREAIENLRYAWEATNFLGEQLIFQQQQIDSTLETLKGYRQQFSLGRRSLLDLLNTEDEYIRAKIALVTSENDYMIAKYRVLNGMGSLVEALGIQLNYEKAPEQK